MSVRGAPEDLALAGGDAPGSLLVALGDAPLPAAAAARPIRFAPHAVAAGDLLVSPYGDRLWRRSPWPAADELFSAPDPVDGAPTLIAGADERRRQELADAARERGSFVITADRLRRGDLEQVAAVALLEAPGRFPPLTFAVAAAGRLVILAAPEHTFGLQDGIDCLLASAPHDRALIDLIDRAAIHAAEFASLRRLGRLAAERHRASEVYARLAIDVALSGAS